MYLPYKVNQSIESRDAQAHLKLGSAYYFQGNLDEAIRKCLQALSIDSRYAEAHNTLSIIYQNRGELNEAVIEYHKALQINPNFTEAQYNLMNAITSGLLLSFLTFAARFFPGSDKRTTPDSIIL